MRPDQPATAARVVGMAHEHNIGATRPCPDLPNPEGYAVGTVVRAPCGQHFVCRSTYICGNYTLDEVTSAGHTAKLWSLYDGRLMSR